MSRRSSFLILFIPWAVLVVAFTVGFLVYNTYVSLTDWYGIFPKYGFVGLANYVQMFQTDGFLETLKNVALLFGLGIPAGLLGALLTAVALDLLRTRRVVAGSFRTIAIVPMAVGAVIAASFWSWMFEYNGGGINGVLHAVGLGSIAANWLGNPQLVMFMIIVVLVWQYAGFGALVLLGALQAIPEAHIEAANLEGASKGRLYWHILIPQIKGHIATLALLLSIYMLKSFDLIWPLTGGGPGWSSTLLPVLVYRTMFQVHDVATGAAIATFTVLVVSAIAIPYIRLTNRQA